MAEEKTFLIKIITPERLRRSYPPDGNFKARCFDPDGRVWEEKGRASHRFCRDFAGSDFDSGRSGRVAR